MAKSSDTTTAEAPTKTPACAKQGSTAVRESYFIEFSATICAQLAGRCAVMCTGGNREAVAMDLALRLNKCDLIGIGRPLCADVACTGRLLAGEITALPRWEDTLQLGYDWMQPFLAWTGGWWLTKLLKVISLQNWYYVRHSALATIFVRQ